MLERMPTDGIRAEDVLAMGSPWRECEIWDGIPMVREPSGGWAEAVASRVMAPLATRVHVRRLGWVFLSSQGFLLARDPDRLLAADGAYVSRARLPVLPRRGFVPMAPDFALEVRSPDDTWQATVEKCGIWIAHGTAVAWAVDPTARLVAVLRPGRAAQVLGPGDHADAAPALPDFSLPVADLFVDLEP